MKIRLGLLLRLGELALVAVALFVVTYVEVQNGSRTGLVVFCVFVIALFGVADQVARALSTERGLESFETALLVEQHMTGLMEALDTAKIISFREVGITVFFVHRTRRHPIRGVQFRVARLRFRATPHPTTIAWSWRKGLLGQCWERGAAVGRDHQTWYGPYAQMTAAEWRHVERKKKERMSRSDMKAVAQFGWVEAHPAIDFRGNYRGCLVVQVDSSKGPLIRGPQALALFEEAAGHVANVAAARA